MRSRVFTLACFIFCFSLVSQAQQPLPNTLLWRISGKNLSKPSYLFGSMHLRDRKLFFFTDSLYQALESTEGFAMEVDPAEMMDSLISKLGDEDRSPKVKDVVASKEYARIRKQLEKKFKVPADQLTTKRLNQIRREAYLNQEDKNKMPTMVDLYLYNIAKNQGKWTGGIEDLADQMSMLDEVGANVDVVKIAEEDSASLHLFVQRLKDAYYDQNLNIISAMVNTPERYNGRDDLSMLKRNKKMTRRIDSLMAIRSCLFVVGSAHLPGDSGLIMHLRDLGFTVEPVLSAKRIDPDDYTYKKIESPWYQFTDENNAYTIEYPGKPSVATIKSVFPLSMFIDPAGNRIYGSGVLAQNGDGTSLQDRLSQFENYLKEGGDFELIDKRKLDTDSTHGIEVVMKQAGTGYYVLRMMAYKNAVFMLMYGGESKNVLGAPEQNRFFNSLHINGKTPTMDEQWKEFVDAECGVKIMLPAVTKAKKFSVEEDGSLYKYYAVPDIREGGYYLLAIGELPPGYYYPSDSAKFASLRESFEEKMNMHFTEVQTMEQNNLPVCRFSGHKKENNEDIAVICLATIRGNRSYTAWAIVAKDKQDYPETSNFFRSFELIPYDKSPWKDQSYKPGTLTLFAPGRLTLKRADTTAGAYFTEKDRITMYSHDPVSGSNFTLERKPLAKLTWYASDTAFLNSMKNQAVDEGDSILYSKSSVNEKTCTIDLITALAGTHLYKQIRYVVTTDTLYSLSGHMAKEMLDDARVKNLFSSFSVNPSGTLTIFENKTRPILDGLLSSDSSTVAEAKQALSEAPLTTADLPALHQALLKHYPLDSLFYNNIRQSIVYQLRDLKDQSSVDFVKQHFEKDIDPELRPAVINLLLAIQTGYSYNTIKELLLQQQPASSSFSAYLFNDSLSLSSTLFPECGSLFADSSYGPPLAAIANSLIDSNLLNAASLATYEDKLIKLAGNTAKKLKENPEIYQEYAGEIVQLLGKFKTASSNAAIRQFVDIRQHYTKQLAVMELLKNRESVAPADLDTLAKDKAIRVDFYKDLKSAGLEKLFPSRYKTKQAFAESYLYSFLTDDDGVVEKINFVQLKSTGRGKDERQYYCFRFRWEGDEEENLAIVGPFAADQSLLVVNEEDDYIWVDEEPYNSRGISAAFQRMIDSRSKPAETKIKY